jgi:isopentenyl diphosphate isomerase/L-lactate dehydrogenase-like FMN-dependent dehydrogenase
MTPHKLPGNVFGGHGDFRNQKRDLNFSDIDFLREASELPVVVKGVDAPEDIRQSITAGAAAIWISNHGGRQIDPASITCCGPQSTPSLARYL